MNRILALVFLIGLGAGLEGVRRHVATLDGAACNPVALRACLAGAAGVCVYYSGQLICFDKVPCHV